MKKSVVFLFLLLGISSLHAQSAGDRYKIEWEHIGGGTVNSLWNDYGISTDFEIVLFFDDGSAYSNRWTWGRIEYFTSKVVDSISLKTYYPDLTCKSYDFVSDFYDHFTIPCVHIEDQPFFRENNPYSFYDDSFIFKITPVNVEIASNSENDILTDCNAITLSANDGYFSYFYNYSVWEYSIGDTGVWNFFRSGSSSINISGTNFSDFLSIAGKENVKFRYNYGCGESNILTFSTMICGPELVSAEGISGCGSGNNGQIRLTYSRPLYEGETLNFDVDFQDSTDPQWIHYGWNDPKVSKNLEQREVTLSGLAPGTYKVRITGYLGGDTQAVYTDESGTYTLENIVISSAAGTAKFKIKETTSVRCSGSNDGTVTVTAGGGSGPYQFELYAYGNAGIPFATSNPFQEEGTISGLPEGSYDVRVFDLNGCEADPDGIRTAQVDGPDEFEIDEVKSQPSTYSESGEEADNGWIAVAISPEDAYHFTWRAGSSTGTVLLEEDGGEASRLENISSGTYYLQITNGAGCSIDSLIVLPAYPPMSIHIVQTGAIACSGDNTGQLEAAVSGGTPPYQYAWYKINEFTQDETLIPGANTAILSSITAGRYRLRIEDAKGSKALSAAVSQTEENPLTATFSTAQLDCSGDSNGFLEITVGGGTPPYSYAWDNGSSGTRIENLTAGNYELLVTDNAGCFKRFMGTVAGPSPLTINALVDQPACSGLSNGSIQLQVGGGNPPYSYTWNDGDGSPARTNLGPGTYSVDISDSKNCETFRREFTLYDPQPMEISLVDYRPITQFGLNNGQFSIRISGGNLPYSVSCLHDGSQTHFPASIQDPGDGSWIVLYENLPSGEYTVTATGNNYQAHPLYGGCITSLQVTFTEPPPLSATVWEEHPITCHNGNDGTLMAEGIGGEPDYFYEWFRKDGTDLILLLSGSNTFSGLAEGVYTVKVTDQNGVSAFSPEYSLLSPDMLTLTFNISPLTCAGGSNGHIEAMAGGGTGFYTYLWDTGETGPVISQKRSGVYSVTVTDRLGCRISGSATLVEPEAFEVNYTIRPLSCYALNDGGIRLEVQGGSGPYTYQWSNGSTFSSAENLAPGDYGVTVTDAKGCTTERSFTIPDLKPITIALTDLKPPIGFGYSDASARFEITGGNPPYTVRGFKEEQELSVPIELTYEGEKAITALQNISEGNYLLRVEDANYQSVREAGSDPCGCLETYSFYVPQPPRLEVQIEQAHSITCHNSSNGALASFAEGGVPFPSGLPYMYQWEKDGVLYETGTAGISGIAPGAYRLKITDSNGIEAWSETVVMDQPDPLALQFQSADIQCSSDTDGWVEVFVTGGTAPYACEWSTGDFTPRVENVSRGKYMVRVTDANRCQITGTVEIIQANAIQIDAQLIQPSCFGGSDGAIHITLSQGEPPYSYYWENNRQTLNYTGLSKGRYTFTVTDAHGCGYETVTYDLGEPDEIFVDLGGDRELCKGQSLTIEAKIPEPARSFTWYDAWQRELFSGASYTLSSAGVYTVKAVTAKGCTAYGEITITSDDREISADFVAASQVPIHDEVFMMNIAVPAPESVEWILPESGDFEVITQNQQLLSIIFHDYGTYSIGMRSYSGNCWETVYKTVRVMDKFDIDHYEDDDEPLLKSFTISPNPASQRFRVDIELKEDSPVDLYLINSGTGVVSAHKQLSGGKVYSEWFEVPVSQQGTYVISLVAPKARGVQKLVLY